MEAFPSLYCMHLNLGLQSTESDLKIEGESAWGREWNKTMWYSLAQTRAALEKVKPIWLW